MRLGAAITVAVAALAVIATASTAGAAGGASHQHLAFVPHLRHARHHVMSAALPTKSSQLKCVATCPAYESTINQYFTDVAAAGVAAAPDNVYSVTTQYSGIQYSETFDPATNAYVDQNPYPSAKCHDGYDKFCVTDGQLQKEIGKVIAAHGWPTHSSTALYFIFTPANVGVCIYPGTARSDFCTTNAFCAYHANTTSNSFLYAVEPDAAAVIDGACDPQQPVGPEVRPAGNGADATINTISHEQIEAITDPFGSGWFAGDTAHEIGDLCAYDFGTPLGTTPGGQQYNQAINGDNYYLQLEYSNAANSNAGGCVPYLGGAVTAPDPRDGSGPMTSHGGAVMTTNTVYAIYWVPTAPANLEQPTISGAAKVGETLKAANGKWSKGPTFTYRWLRCTVRHIGQRCVGITKATGRTYTLVPADAGHRIEVRVTGSNSVGQASAISNPTPKVR